MLQVSYINILTFPIYLQSKYGQSIEVPGGIDGTRLNFRLESGYVFISIE